MLQAREEPQYARRPQVQDRGQFKNDAASPAEALHLLLHE